jgi:hypothetical protein
MHIANNHRYIDDPVLGKQKLCSRCGEYWPMDSEFFHAKKGNRQNLHSYCIACEKEYIAQYRAARPETWGGYMREYRKARSIRLKNERETHV